MNIEPRQPRYLCLVRTCDKKFYSFIDRDVHSHQVHCATPGSTIAGAAHTNHITYPFETEGRHMNGSIQLRKAIEAMIVHGAWFVVTPMPDNVWRITFKAGEGLSKKLTGWL